MIRRNSASRVGRSRSVASLALAMSCVAARGQLQLPHIFSDHAVLQRDRPIRVWGWDKPGARVSASLNGQSAHAVASQNGAWVVWLRPEKAGGPYDLEVSGTTTVQIHDLLMGDVWIGSGQSNMEVPLKGYPGRPIVGSKEAIAAASLPEVRLLRVEHESEDVPQADIQAVWTTTSPTTAADFSAVAFLFGRGLNSVEKVPIGLIEAAWGGTYIEPWISMDALGHDAALIPVFSSYAAYGRDHLNAVRNQAAEQKAYEAARRANQPLPDRPWHASPATEPAALYNGMIAPIIGYGIKGVIWYQGEANASAEKAPLYGKLLTTLAQDWRLQWQQGDFPFIWVQLTSYAPGGDWWGRLRDQQRRSLSLINTGMAVIYDVGEAGDVHPVNKAPVANRLALAARALAYGEQVEFSGPLFRQATIEEGLIRVWFDHASGLRIRGDHLQGFEIAGADLHFADADATLRGDTVEVHSDKVPVPRFVRYAWHGDTPANLFNSADLPASTFTSEDFR